MFWVWTLLIYWVVFFAASYFILEQGQNYFYDEVTKGAPWKVAVGSLVFAVLLTWRNSTMIDMFTNRIGETALLAILAWIVFTVVYQFHPQHAAMIGPFAVVVIAAATALAVESLANSGRTVVQDRRTINRPIRKPAGGTGLQPLPSEEPSEPAKGASTP